MTKWIAEKLHNLAYRFHRETYQELKAKFWELRGGQEEDYCERCDCFCKSHPCVHTLARELESRS